MDENKNIYILKALKIKVERGNTILVDIPFFAIREGETVSLIGPNGAGKTTLLQTLCYLLKPFEGEIYFRGDRVGEKYPLNGYRRKLAMVFQEPLLFDTTVFNNVASGLKFRGVKRSEIKNIVMDNLRRFGIEHLSDRSARTLSGGEAQRTSLARAFATMPEILLLDEPFSALDPPTREALVEDVEKILKKSGITSILVTHDRMEALRLSHRIAVMKDGQILQIGSPAEIMNHPASEFVASFVGVETTLDGTVAGKEDGVLTVSVEGQIIEAVGDMNIGEHVILCIRPEQVVVSHNSVKGSTSLRNIFSGTVLKVTPLGPYQKIHLDCGFPLVAYITNSSNRKLALEEGKEITASFKATSVHVIAAKESNNTQKV
ncbi:MAG: ABC transporter ATP-binding protein [Proteobacteria bacterium]|nr:ABC transporter ATP-binding protein [Pseudomonadota bacterium]